MQWTNLRYKRNVQKYHEIGCLKFGFRIAEQNTYLHGIKSFAVEQKLAACILRLIHLKAAIKLRGKLLFEKNLEVSFTSARDRHESYYVSATVPLSLYLLSTHGIDIVIFWSSGVPWGIKQRRNIWTLKTNVSSLLIDLFRKLHFPVSQYSKFPTRIIQITNNISNK